MFCTVSQNYQHHCEKICILKHIFQGTQRTARIYFKKWNSDKMKVTVLTFRIELQTTKMSLLIKQLGQIAYSVCPLNYRLQNYERMSLKISS